jgi:hypothetical protein
MPRMTKAEIQRRRDEADARNRIFFLWESIQRAENGGHPCPNDANIGHGEPVYTVKKRELMEFMAGVRQVINEWEFLEKKTAPGCLSAAIEEIRSIVNRVLEENQFIMPLRELGTPKTD